MDSALSHWMAKKSWGGKPVVLRRNVPQEDGPLQIKASRPAPQKA